MNKVAKTATQRIQQAIAERATVEIERRSVAFIWFRISLSDEQEPSAVRVHRSDAFIAPLVALAQNAA